MTKILTKAEWELSVAEAWGKAIESGLRETVAEWMIERDYATGHGDTVEDLLKELEWQVKERERERMIADGWRQCAEGQSTTQYCGLLEDAVKAERKARKPTSAHDKVYSEVDLANAYQKGWDAAMLRRSLGGT
jgi:hypothetical protein